MPKAENLNQSSMTVNETWEMRTTSNEQGIIKSAKG